MVVFMTLMRKDNYLANIKIKGVPFTEHLLNFLVYELAVYGYRVTSHTRKRKQSQGNLKVPNEN